MNETATASSTETAITVRNGHTPALSIHTSKWTLRRDIVDRALLKLPEEQRGPLRWLDAYGRNSNLSLREVAALVKKPDGSSYDENTLYKILTGVHAAKPDNFIRCVEAFQKPFSERESAAKIPFVKTSQANSIISYVEKCRKYGRMGLVFGRNQSGKTETFKQIQIERPYGQVEIFRVPTNGFLSQLVERMARQKKIAIGNHVSETKEKLIASFDSSMTIVFDEMHQCYAKVSNMNSPRKDTFEFGREIYDVTGATVIEVATPVVLQHMTDGPDALFYEQLLHRSLPPLVLNDLVPTKDLNDFAELIGLGPADDAALTLQTNVITKEGLGFWLMYLQCARGIAENKKRPVEWDDVIAAEKEFKKMSRRGK